MQLTPNKGLTKFTSAITLIVLTSLSGCSFVEPIPGSETIVFVSNIDDCKKLGDTTVSVLSEIAMIDRSEESMQDELTILAKNAALKMGGNAIKPSSDIENGGRSYNIYSCNY